MTLVQIGAGNIGRSFIGQLFARAGYEVVFIDVAQDIIQALNQRRSYAVEIRDENPETIRVENVRGVDGRDVEAAAKELAAADIAGTAVGPGALPYVYPTIARGLVLRHERGGAPLDIIICENLRNAAEAFRDGLRPHLLPEFSLDGAVGLIETSIGKMVPIMTEEQHRADPLLVFAEAYNTLICDGQAFRNPVPQGEGLDPKTNMGAYVDRKLFVHNLGHAAAAYLGHLEAPEATYVWEAVAHDVVGPAVREAMWESGRSLMMEYPDEFCEADIDRHIEDLLRRFRNQALGDTIYRVGRDVPRKLGRDDRIIGALRLDERHGVPAPTTTRCAAAAMLFRGTDEHGEVWPADRELAEKVRAMGPEHILSEVCGLTADSIQDSAVRQRILTEHASLGARNG